MVNYENTWSGLTDERQYWKYHRRLEPSMLNKLIQEREVKDWRPTSNYTHDNF